MGRGHPPPGRTPTRFACFGYRTLDSLFFSVFLRQSSDDQLPVDLLDAPGPIRSIDLDETSEARTDVSGREPLTQEIQRRLPRRHFLLLLDGREAFLPSPDGPNPNLVEVLRD